MKILTFAILLLVFVSCEKNEDAVAVQPLTGTWEWVRTDGGFASHIHDTPASAGKTVTWKFTDNLTYFRYENEVLKSQGTYSEETKTCIHSGEEKTFINLSSDQGFMIEKLDARTLETSDEYYDGVGSEFRKKTGATD